MQKKKKIKAKAQHCAVSSTFRVNQMDCKRSLVTSSIICLITPQIHHYSICFVGQHLPLHERIQQLAQYFWLLSVYLILHTFDLVCMQRFDCVGRRCCWLHRETSCDLVSYQLSTIKHSGLFIVAEEATQDTDVMLKCSLSNLCVSLWC